MRLERARAWAAIAILLIQIAVVWELWRTHTESDVRDVRLLIMLAFTLLVTGALLVWERRVNRRLAGGVQVAGDELRLAMESGHAVGWDWDIKSGRDVFFGDLKTMFGIDAQRFVGHVDDFRRYIHPDDRETVWKAVVDARESGTVYMAAYRVVWPDGTVRWVAASGKFYYTADGAPVRMLGIATDVTERARAEQALRESEERFRLMADTAPVMLWMSGTDKLCNYFNRPWLDFTGRSLDAELGNGWADGVHSEDMKRCLNTYEEAYDKREAFTMEYRLRRHDGQYRWVLDNGAPRFALDGSFAGYIGSCVDITTQKVAHAALADLSHKLMNAQETERARLARELHDDIGQRMAVLTMELDGLDLALPLSMTDLRIRIGTLSNRARDLSKDIQAISHSLHSSKLDYLGIVSACAGFCRELSEQQSVDIDFSHDGIPDEVPKDLALCIFRVLQEAVTNAVKYSGVDHVTVGLRGVGDEIRLEVVDNGIGFDPAAAIRGPGLGLISMTERLSLVMGELSIESRPGAGAIIRARMPLSRSVGLSAGARG